MTSGRRVRASAVCLAMLVCNRAALAQCPVGSEIEVDHDIPGSGYSEESDNWTSWQTAACHLSYRYLSHTVGDGSRKGKAIWKPAIAVEGWYEVRTSFRATVNRTDDADYVVYDDAGQTAKTVVNQKFDGDCRWQDLGVHFCAPGGECRVVLDGTDDSQSDCADMTTFTLISCDAPPDAATATGACDGIRANASWEVCEETATTCAGTFADGAGCAAYCAAAAMTCTARFGGEPGCLKEPQNPIECAATNGHASDWCECAAPGGAGGSAGAGGAPADGGVQSGGAAGDEPGAGAQPGGGAGGTGGGWPSDAGAGAPSSAGGTVSSDAGDAAEAARGEALADDESGCACRASPRPPSGGLAWLAALGATLGAARRRLTRWPEAR